MSNSRYLVDINIYLIQIYTKLGNEADESDWNLELLTLFVFLEPLIFLQLKREQAAIEFQTFSKFCSLVDFSRGFIASLIALENLSLYLSNHNTIYWVLITSAGTDN